jgi:tripartite-type tricarboxylate transporter receptor subunit TctC
MKKCVFIAMACLLRARRCRLNRTPRSRCGSSSAPACPLDTFARLIVDKMSTALKQPFVVENKAGAGGNIAAELVAKSPADGYTLLFSIDTTFTVNPWIYKTLPFDPVKDFAVISVPVTYGQLLAVHPSVPAKSVAELVALAKQKKLTYASGGNGTPSHLSGAYFLATTGIDMTHVPYKGPASR